MLDFSNNKIEVIPDNLRKAFVGLLSLNLSKNNLKTISSTVIVSFQTLRTLDVSFNFLESVPYKEGQISTLESLDIKGNPITSLPCFLARSEIKALYFDWALTDFAEDRIKSEMSGYSFKVEQLPRSIFSIKLNYFFTFDEKSPLREDTSDFLSFQDYYKTHCRENEREGFLGNIDQAFKICTLFIKYRMPSIPLSLTESCPDLYVMRGEEKVSLLQRSIEYNNPSMIDRFLKLPLSILKTAASCVDGGAVLHRAFFSE